MQNIQQDKQKTKPVKNVQYLTLKIAKHQMNEGKTTSQNLRNFGICVVISQQNSLSKLFL